MGDTDGWRRAALDYRSKFEEDFVFSVPGALEGAPPLRIAQAPSATAAEKRVGCLRPAAPSDRRGAGSSSRDAGPASSSSPAVSDDAEDPIPATGFTVWDAGVLLGAYVSQPEVWRRLTTAADVPPRKLEDDDAMASTRSTLRGLSLTGSNEPVRPSDECLTVLELGAGTGVAGLALASTGLPSAVALTDLPGVCAFLRHNAARNKAAPPPRDEFGKNRKRVFPERTSAGRSVGRFGLARERRASAGAGAALRHALRRRKAHTPGRSVSVTELGAPVLASARPATPVPAPSSNTVGRSSRGRFPGGSERDSDRLRSVGDDVVVVDAASSPAAAASAPRAGFRGGTSVVRRRHTSG